jgi:hypothetical protein
MRAAAPTSRLPAMADGGEAEYIFHAAHRPALEAWLATQGLIAQRYATDMATGVACFVVVPVAELRLDRGRLPRRDDDPPHDAAEIVRT